MKAKLLETFSIYLAPKKKKTFDPDRSKKKKKVRTDQIKLSKNTIPAKQTNKQNFAASSFQ